MALPLIHHADYDASSVPDGHRFPMRKYARVAERLRARGAVFTVPRHAPEAWLMAVHDPAYVAAILNQTLDRAAARRIGFEITAPLARRAAASAAGTTLAARIALDTGVAANLAGGSHHAGPHGGAGFCVFNDVAVAARQILDDRLVRRFAGTDAVFTFSLHCEDNWPRTKPPSDLDMGLAKGAGDAAYLEALSQALPTVFDRARPDLVFYNAGVDPHREDRLGHLALTDDGLAARDRLVAEACQARGVPICGVLGGGYGQDPDAVAGRHLFMIEALAELAGGLSAPPGETGLGRDEKRPLR